MIIINIIGLLLAGVILVLSGSLTIKTLLKIASYLNLSDYTIGFIIMAFATSLPELFIGINSILANTPSLALGDILGSNIVDLTLVLGLVAILARKIQIKGKIAIRDTYLAVFIAILPILLMLDRDLNRTDAIVLLFVFSFYIIKLWWQRKRFKKTSNSISKKEFIKNIILLIVGMALLLISANLMVSFSTTVALGLGVPLILIGVIIVAIGTGLPELVFEIKAVMIKREGMSIGNALGSVVVQGTMILGIVGLISPFTIENFKLFLIAAVFLLLSLALFTFFLRTKDALSWKEGMILIMLYIIFIIVELIFN